MAEDRSLGTEAITLQCTEHATSNYSSLPLPLRLRMLCRHHLHLPACSGQLQGLQLACHGITHLSRKGWYMIAVAVICIGVIYDEMVHKADRSPSDSLAPVLQYWWGWLPFAALLLLVIEPMYKQWQMTANGGPVNEEGPNPTIQGQAQSPEIPESSQLLRSRAQQIRIQPGGQGTSMQLISATQQKALSIAQIFQGHRKLSFDDAMDYQATAARFSKQADHALSAAAQNLASLCPQACQLILNILTKDKAVQQAPQLAARFSPAIMKMLKEGSAAFVKNRSSGAFMATVQCVKTGKFIEQATVSMAPAVGTAGNASTTAATAAASFMTVAITAAHVVADYDNAKTLKRIDKKLDVMLQRWEQERDAALRTIYEVFMQHISLPDLLTNARAQAALDRAVDSAKKVRFCPNTVCVTLAIWA